VCSERRRDRHSHGPTTQPVGPAKRSSWADPPSPSASARKELAGAGRSGQERPPRRRSQPSAHSPQSTPSRAAHRAAAAAPAPCNRPEHGNAPPAGLGTGARLPFALLHTTVYMTLFAFCGLLIMLHCSALCPHRSAHENISARSCA
jgi:hypothetical protein